MPSGLENENDDETKNDEDEQEDALAATCVSLIPVDGPIEEWKP